MIIIYEYARIVEKYLKLIQRREDIVINVKRKELRKELRKAEKLERGFVGLNF